MPEGQFNLLKLPDAEPDLTRWVEIRPGARVQIKYIGVRKWRKIGQRVRQMGGSDVARDMASEAQSRNLLADHVLGWEGMSRDVVAELMPVDPAGLPDEIPYSRDNVVALLTNSGEFGRIVAQAVDDLAAFREAKTAEEQKN